MSASGLAPLLEARGAPRTTAALWTPYGGRIHFPDDDLYGFGVTRRTLDPIVRRLAAETPGVELLLGQTAVKVAHHPRHPTRGAA